MLRVAAALVDGLLLELELDVLLEGLEVAEDELEDDGLPELVPPDALPPDDVELPGASNGFGRRADEGTASDPDEVAIEGSPLASRRLLSIRIAAGFLCTTPCWGMLPFIGNGSPLPDSLLAAMAICINIR